MKDRKEAKKSKIQLKKAFIDKYDRMARQAEGDLRFGRAIIMRTKSDVGRYMARF